MIFDFLLHLVLALIMVSLEVREFNDVRREIERATNSKMDKYHIRTLESIRSGSVNNLQNFKDVWQVYLNAPPGDREAEAETLRSHYVGLVTVLRTEMPHLQREDYAVQALPNFATLASVHVLMLAEGIKHGESWGFPREFVHGVLRAEFNARTGSGTVAPAVPRGGNSSSSARGGGSSSSSVALSRRAGHDMQVERLSAAIADGAAKGWDAGMLGTWKGALASLGAPPASEVAADYPTYARETYERGRHAVRPLLIPGLGLAERGERNPSPEHLQALADYDAHMIANVLRYAECWPYMTGEFEVPRGVLAAVDREIWAGPFGRVRWPVAWAHEPPAVEARPGNLSAIRVRAGKNVDGVQTRYGAYWGKQSGSASNGKEHQVDLGPGEYIESVDLAYGAVAGSVAFRSNKGAYGPFGSRKRTPLSLKKHEPAFPNVTMGISVNRTGYALSSIQCSGWRRRGCLGLYFGFRPVQMATDSFVHCGARCGMMLDRKAPALGNSSLVEGPRD